MTKKDIIKKIADKHEEFTQKEVGMIVDEMIDAIKSAIVAGDKVAIAKFGTFEVAFRDAREGRNPQTGESMTIAASKRPKFKPSKTFKDEVNV